MLLNYCSVKVHLAEICTLTSAFWFICCNCNPCPAAEKPSHWAARPNPESLALWSWPRPDIASEILSWFQKITYRKPYIASPMITWPMTCRDHLRLQKVKVMTPKSLRLYISTAVEDGLLDNTETRTKSSVERRIWGSGLTRVKRNRCYAAVGQIPRSTERISCWLVKVSGWFIPKIMKIYIQLFNLCGLWTLIRTWCSCGV